MESSEISRGEILNRLLQSGYIDLSEFFILAFSEKVDRKIDIDVYNPKELVKFKDKSPNE